MVTKIQKWGNSLGVRIPKTVAHGVRVKDGTAVRLEVEDGRLIVEPVNVKIWRLRDLVTGVTAKNRHGEADTGRAVGREVW